MPWAQARATSVGQGREQPRCRLFNTRDDHTALLALSLSPRKPALLPPAPPPGLACPFPLLTAPVPGAVPIYPHGWPYLHRSKDDISLHLSPVTSDSGSGDSSRPRPLAPEDRGKRGGTRGRPPSSSKAHFKGGSPPLGIPEPPGCGKGSRLVGDRNVPYKADKASYTSGTGLASPSGWGLPKFRSVCLLDGIIWVLPFPRGAGNVRC